MRMSTSRTNTIVERSRGGSRRRRFRGDGFDVGDIRGGVLRIGKCSGKSAVACEGPVGIVEYAVDIGVCAWECVG